MRSPLFSTLLLSASALAAPLASWSPALGEFYAAIDKHVQIARQDSTRTVYPATCDLAKAVQPIAPTPLPAPDPSWRLTEVLLGRGVQNYTCSSNSKDAKPKAIGAIASLYNTSCLAASYPKILSLLPPLVLQYALPADSNLPLVPSNLAPVGHHYFNASGTPVFDLSQIKTSVSSVSNVSSKGANDFGVAYFKANSNSTAPADAAKGENGAGNGAVPWLLLDAVRGTSGETVAVYRLNTAGGKAPATCETSPAVFSVQYATEYWFYSKKGGIYA